MTAKVVCETKGACKVVLQSGESFGVSIGDLPESLKQGGEIELAFCPAGEQADVNNTKELLNYLLHIEQD